MQENFRRWKVISRCRCFEACIWLQPCSDQYRLENDMEQTRKDMAERYQDERYFELDKYDVAEVLLLISDKK